MDDYSLTASPGRTLPVAVRGAGLRIWDRDGVEWLDACGGAMVMSLGHCHPRLVEAVRRQAAELTFTYRFSFSNEPMIELAGLLREIAPMERALGVLQLVRARSRSSRPSTSRSCTGSTSASRRSSS